MTGFHTSGLTPCLGTVVTDLDLSRDMSDATMKVLIAMLFDRGVLVIKAQRLSKADYSRFGKYWGRPLTFFIPEHRDSQYPEIITINNDPATPPEMRDGAVHWHSDSSYETEPGAVTMLMGKEAPEEGGETHFASTLAAYDALSDEMKAKVDPLVAHHELGSAPWIAGETRPDSNRPSRKTDAPRHPLIMVHPVTGRKGIFTSGTAGAIEGMDPDEATALIRQLREHVARPEFRATYKVEQGDIILWDNFGTVHCASPIEYSNAPGKRRSLLRISTKGMPDLIAA